MRQIKVKNHHNLSLIIKNILKLTKKIKNKKMICFKMNSRIFVFFKMRKKEIIVIIGFIIELIEFKFEFQRKKFNF